MSRDKTDAEKRLMSSEDLLRLEERDLAASLGLKRNPMGPTVMREVLEELTRARKMHSPMNSPHEGYAVILEEADELWAEVKKRPDEYDPAKARTEAIQVAAMAMRFVLDVCDGEQPASMRETIKTLRAACMDSAAALVRLPAVAGANPDDDDKETLSRDRVVDIALTLRDVCDTERPNDGPTRPPQSWRDRMAGGPMTFRDATDAERKKVGVDAPPRVIAPKGVIVLLHETGQHLVDGEPYASYAAACRASCESEESDGKEFGGGDVHPNDFGVDGQTGEDR